MVVSKWLLFLGLVGADANLTGHVAIEIRRVIVCQISWAMANGDCAAWFRWLVSGHAWFDAGGFGLFNGVVGALVGIDDLDDNRLVSRLSATPALSTTRASKSTYSSSVWLGIRLRAASSARSASSSAWSCTWS